MAKASEGVKLDRIEFSLDISTDVPKFKDIQECQDYFQYPIKEGIRKYRFAMHLEDGVMLYFSNRRGNSKFPCGQIFFYHNVSNEIPIDSIFSKVSRYIPPGFYIKNMCRVDVCSDKLIPFKEFISKIAPLGMDVNYCHSEYSAIYRSAGNPGTYQFGQGDVVIRIYNKQHEQKVDFAWSRAEMQFRTDKITQASPKENSISDIGFLDTVLSLVSHGLEYFRPLKTKKIKGHYELSEVSEYWLELFSTVADPGKLPPRRRNNAYYV